MEGMGTHFAYRYKYQDVGAQDAAGGPDAAGVTAYPNPFNAAVKIADSGQRLADNFIGILIYDVKGKIVHKLSATSYQLSAGIIWNAADHPAGVYLLKAKIGKKTWMKKLVLVK